MKKPRLFIGSSSEAKTFASSVMRALEDYAEVTPWFSGVFKANNSFMDDLENQLSENDFAVFVFGNDDIINHRGKTLIAPRDNTVFEMGLFWGQLGRERVFYIIPSEVERTVDDEEIKDFHIPSDLHGLVSKKTFSN